MRLRRLEMIGFKSFMDKTVITFDQPITVIVGPNGCGKSNVVDAIRWVMGEQSPKHLRGKHMEDVIFGGSEKAAPLSMASVEVTFNADGGGFPPPYHEFHEVALCRRLYRDGTSEYLINRLSVRLRDIIDFFSGTGLGKAHYAIVEQGRIAQLITAKAEERRGFIEEAAGVSRFKARKEAALRKIDACQGNLLRLADILQELERQMRSLERQVAKAERYKRLSEDLRGKDLAVSATHYHRLAERLATLGDEHRRLEEELQGLEAQLATSETEFSAVQLKQSEEERRLSDLQEKDYQLQNELNLLKSSERHKKEEEDNRTRALQSLEEELASLGARLTTLSHQWQTWQAEEGTLEEKATTLRQAYETAHTQFTRTQADEMNVLQTLQKSKEDRFRLSSQLEAQRDRETHLEERRTTIAVKTKELADRRSGLDQTIAAIDAAIREDQSALATTTQLKLQLEQDRNSLADSIVKTRQDLTERTDLITQCERELHKKRSRLESLETLEKNFEGYTEGVRFVMNTLSKPDSIIGTLAQLLEIEPQYEAALAAFLSDKLQYLLCRNHDDAQEILSQLKQEGQGRVALAPMSLKRRHSETAALLQADGVIGSLASLVKIKSGHEDWVAHFLEHAILVDHLSTALRLFNDHQDHHLPVIVTMDGDILDPSGVLIGGKAPDASKTLLANRREQRTLSDDITTLERDLSLHDEMKRRLVGRLENMEFELETLKRSAHEEDVKRIEMENRLSSETKERARLSAQVNEFAAEMETLTQESARIETTVGELETRRSQMNLEVDRLTTLISEKDAILAELKLRLETEREAATTLKLSLAAADADNARFREEGQRLKQDLDNVTESNSRRQRDIDANRDRLTQLATELATLSQQTTDINALHETLRLQFSQCKDAYRSGQDALRERELNLHRLRKHHKEQFARFHQLSLELQEGEMKRTTIFEYCRNTYELDLPAWIESTHPSLLSESDEALFQQEVQDLRQKIANLGPVNVDAIAEFEEIKGRYEFLTQQKTDLETSLQGLQEAIVTIDQTTQKRMIEAYQFINEAFSREFPRLFGGGRATLSLTNEADILDSGIEVFAQPPGKKLQSIDLLSGGEKALTALSLLFSILAYRPSPFCILDEVDAPLDEQNVHRYNDLIRNMIDRTQFIMITHAKSSMEIADTLYGVTMPDPGISKIVSVDLNERKQAEQAA